MNFNISILLLAFSVTFFSCKNSENGNNNKASEKNGGTFVMAENIEIGSIFPVSVTNQAEAIIVGQIHESLVRLDSKTLEAIPGLAEKWEVSPDGKQITFHLKKGVHFQDDKCYKDGKGPEITAKDVLFSLKTIATKTPDNYKFTTILQDRLAGANDFFNGNTETISGVKIINDYTISLDLVNPSLSFLKLLANPSAAIISETAFKAYGKDLKTGAGPFMYDASSNNEKIVLHKNPNYFLKDSAGISLPYLDTIIVLVTPSIEDGLSMFENQKLI